MERIPAESEKKHPSLFPVEEMDGSDMRMQATSETDMTGLIPRGILNEEDAESYNEIYPYLPPYVDNDQM